MSTQNEESRSSYRIAASGLSGVVRQPFAADIPTLAESVLSHAEGFKTKRSPAFNLNEVVSVSSAYTLVTARKDEGGSILTLATAVVEDLNILEIFTARRVVSQMTITVAPDNGPRRISFAGSRFEGLRLAGHDSIARLNVLLQPPVGRRGGPGLPLAWDNDVPAGQPRAPSLFGEIEPESEETIQCATDGPIVNIPGFGRIILGELILDSRRDSVELVSFRAVLGCPVEGQVTGPQTMTSGGGGSGGDKAVHKIP